MRYALLKQDCGSEEPVLTPRAEDLHPVLGPVVTAQRYPITSWSKVTDRRSCPSSAREPNRQKRNRAPAPDLRRHLGGQDEYRATDHLVYPGRGEIPPAEFSP